MCLIAFALRPDPEHRLILAANRDEFHARPAAPLARWTDDPAIAGGRDLEAGGTWLAASASGRFATVTNARDAVPKNRRFRSRGLLVPEFLNDGRSALDFVRAVEGERYAGFNLLAFDGKALAYGSNRDERRIELEDGVFALSNAALETPWFKVTRIKAALSALIGAGRPDDEALFSMLGDPTRAPKDAIGDTVLPFAKAHRLSAPFIVDEDYGTRCSTIVRVFDDGSITLAERRFNSMGEPTGHSSVSMPAKDG